jgi:hypothetical protein
MPPELRAKFPYAADVTFDVDRRTQTSHEENSLPKVLQRNQR